MLRCAPRPITPKEKKKKKPQKKKKKRKPLFQGAGVGMSRFFGKKYDLITDDKWLEEKAH